MYEIEWTIKNTSSEVFCAGVYQILTVGNADQDMIHLVILENDLDVGMSWEIKI